MTLSHLVRALLPAVMFLLPCLGGFWLVDQARQADWRADVAERRALLERLSAQFARRADRHAVIQEAATRLIRALTWGADPEPILAALPAGAVRVFLFDGAGKRMNRPGFASGLVVASERCHALLRAVVQGTARTLSVRDRTLVESFLGSEGALPLMADNPGKLQTLESFGMDRSVGVFPFRTRTGVRRRGSFILLLEHRQVEAAHLVEGARQRLHALVGTEFRFAALALEPASLPAGAPVIRGPVPDLPAAGMEGFFRYDGLEWHGRVHARRFLLLVGAPALVPPAPLYERHPIGAVAFVLFLGLGGLASWRLARQGLSIRLHVALIFGAVVTVSLVVVLGFGATWLRARRTTLVSDRFEQGREILERVDTALPSFVSRLERRFQKVADAVTVTLAQAPPASLLEAPPVPAAGTSSAFFPVSLIDTPAGTAGTRERIGRILRRVPGAGTVLAVDVFDASGTCLYQGPSTVDGVYRSIWGEAFHRVLGEVAAIVLEPPGKSHRSFASAPSLIRRMGGNLRVHRGRIRVELWITRPLTAFFQTIPDRAGSPTAALWIRIREQAIERLHLRETTRLLDAEKAGVPFPFRVFAVDARGKVSSRVGRRLPGHVLTDLTDTMAASRLPCSRAITFANRPYLLVGLPSRHWRGAFLFLVSPLDALERESQALVTGFLAFAGLVCLFACGLAITAARMLLAPLVLIGEALQDLASSRVRGGGFGVSTGDEFESIARGIHQTGEELWERRTAQTIQEHLLPPAPLVSGGLAVQGWTRSRSEIGGEIFDHLSLGPDRVAMWVSGAPGNSVASALLLAMTKMALRLFLENPAAEPAAVLTDLDRQFSGRVRGFDRGTVFVGCVDLVRRRFQAARRGDFLVLRLAPDGGIRPADPGEGSGSTGSSPQPLAFALQPGERVLVLSGGCPCRAAPPDEGERFWLELATEVGGMPLAEAGPRILDRLETRTEGGQATRTLFLCEVDGR